MANAPNEFRARGLCLLLAVILLGLLMHSTSSCNTPNQNLSEVAEAGTG